MLVGLVIGLESFRGRVARLLAGRDIQFAGVLIDQLAVVVVGERPLGDVFGVNGSLNGRLFDSSASGFVAA